MTFHETNHPKISSVQWARFFEGSVSGRGKTYVHLRPPNVLRSLRTQMVEQNLGSCFRFAAKLHQGVRVERRENVRYLLGTPVSFEWVNELGVQLEAEGLSRDISVLGAFVLSAKCPPTDSNVQLTVSLPAAQANMRSLQMRGRGRVLRVEPKHGQEATGGFAVLSDGFELYPPATGETKTEFNTAKKLLELRRRDD